MNLIDRRGDLRRSMFGRRIGVGELAKAFGAGALAGVVGTIAMSTVMLPARWVGLLGTQPPRRVADRLIDEAGGGASVPEDQRRVATSLVHLGTGAMAGAVLGVGHLVTRPPGSALIGLGFGMTLWALNYVVAAPALELFPPPWEDRPGRPPVMLAAHAIYGVVTATLVDQMVGR